MTVKKLAIIITIRRNKLDRCYQVHLSDSEVEMVENFLVQLHKGPIKVLDRELDLTIETQGGMGWECARTMGPARR